MPAVRAMRWLRRVIWLGIAVNLGLVVAGLFCPYWLTSVLSLGRPEPAVWLQALSVVLFSITLIYLPAAFNPWGHRLYLRLAILARFNASVFFIAAGGPFVIFGAVELVLWTSQLFLLWRASDTYPA
jgi:hypothetical protein